MAYSLATLPPILLHSSYIPTLSPTLLSELSLIPSRISGYLTGLPLLPQSHTDFSTPSFACVECCLRLLESYLLGRWDRKGTSDDAPACEVLDSNRGEIIEGLLACSLATDILVREADSEDGVSQSEFSRLHDHKVDKPFFSQQMPRVDPSGPREPLPR